MASFMSGGRISLPGSLIPVLQLEDAIRRLNIGSSSALSAFEDTTARSVMRGLDPEWRVIINTLRDDEPSLRRMALHGIERALPAIRITLTNPAIRDELIEVRWSSFFCLY